MFTSQGQNVQGIIEPDETSVRDDHEDEAIESDSIRSSLASITSSIRQGKVGEGGRTYAVYGREEYGLPMDEKELDRIDMAHGKYYVLLEKNLFLAPIGDTPQRILELGCGTGIWTIDVADQFPFAEVIGVDIAPTQPGWVPPNCRFELDDIEQPWTWKENHFDFIFFRDPIACIRDFPALLSQCYNHLKPGGWVEFQCVTGIATSDDDSIPEGNAFKAFSDNLRKACSGFGTPIEDPILWREQFEAQRFEAVTEKVYKLPCNPWPKDERMKFLGACEMENLLINLEGLCHRLYQKGLGWSAAEVDVFLVDVRKAVQNRSTHVYWPYYVVYGRKPVGSETISKTT